MKSFVRVARLIEFENLRVKISNKVNFIFHVDHSIDVLKMTKVKFEFWTNFKIVAHH